MMRMAPLRSLAVTLAALVPLGVLAPAVAAPPWSPIKTLSAQGANAQAATIKGSPDGGQVAAWTVGSPNRAVLQVARRPAGKGWSKPVTISARGAMTPRLAVGAKGRACLAWQLKRAGKLRPQGSCFVPKRGWSKPRFFTPAGSVSATVDVAMRGGAAVFVWDRFGNRDRVQTMRRSSSGSWSATTTLSSNGASGSAPAVALDGNGLATVAWGESEPGGHRAIVVRRQKAGGGWTPGAILTPAGQDAVAPVIAEVQSGRALVAWGTASEGVWSAYRPGATALWDAAIQASPLGVTAGSPAVAANRTDDVFVLAWRAELGSGPVVQMTRRQFDGSWTLVHQVSTTDSVAVFDPDVVLDAQQFATVVWQEHDGAQYRIGFMRQSNAGTWSPLSYLDVASSGGAYVPKATIVGNYTVSMIWRRYDGDDKLRVQTRSYDPAAA